MTILSFRAVLMNINLLNLKDEMFTYFTNSLNHKNATISHPSAKKKRVS